MTQSSSIIAIVIAIVLLMVATLKPAAVHAATITVSAGTDTIAADGVCHLSEAIENVNNQAQTHADCPAGTGNDIIQLPAGTITLSEDLPVLTGSVTVQGGGTNRSIINGSGQYSVIQFNAPTGDLVFKDFKARSFGGSAIMGQDAKSIDIKNIEADGNGSISKDMGDGTTFIGGFGFISSGAEPPSISINDFYAHDFTSSDANFLAGIAVMGPNGKTQKVTGRNITISNLESTNPEGQLMGIFSTTGMGGGFRSLNGTYENITIENIKSMDALNVSGFAISGVIGGGDSTATVSLRNATIRNITTGPSNYGGNGAIGLIGGAVGPEDHIEGSIKLQNVVIANVSVDGTSNSCSKNDISGPLGGQGTTSLSIESLGGNISDDKSCNDYLKHASDKTNQTKLKDTLGKLSNNGGAVPTIPLLVGSPAIDAGICEKAPAKDVRGVMRPQGADCDSGAYEVQQAGIASPSGIANAVTGKRVYLTPPIPGSIVSAAELLDPAKTATDAGYDYPLGLASFTIEGVPSGSTQTVELYFETDEKAENFVLRKYNDRSKTFQTIDDATLTNTTKHGTPVIKVTYHLTDGGALDLDGTANGTLVDPAGLAKRQQASLVNTGTMTFVSTFLATAIIVVVIWTYVDYRRHRAPLAHVDKQLARSYTYWHHVRVVTLPLLRYRLTFVFEKQMNDQLPQ